MLAHDKLAEQFVGGTVYQAFLSALSYHRWHSPVSGKIVKAGRSTLTSQTPTDRYKQLLCPVPTLPRRCTMG